LIGGENGLLSPPSVVGMLFCVLEGFEIAPPDTYFLKMGTPPALITGGIKTFELD